MARTAPAVAAMELAMSELQRLQQRCWTYERLLLDIHESEHQNPAFAWNEDTSGFLDRIKAALTSSQTEAAS